MTLHKFVYCFAVLAICFAKQCPAMVDVEKSASIPVNAMRSSRESLIRGKFRANFRRYLKNGAGARPPKIDEIRCSFDFSQGLFRFERLAQGSQIGNDSTTSTRNKQQRDFETRYYIRNGEYSANWQPVTGIADKRPPNEKPFGWDILQPFDPRWVGLASLGGFTGQRFGNDDTRTLFDYYVTKLQETSEVSKELVKLTWHPDEKVRTVIWVDKTKGYSPVRFEQAYEQPQDFVSDLGEASWKSLNGAWVPTDFYIEFRTGAGEVERLEGQFEWENVNEDVPNSEFTIEGLNLPKGTVVRDMRAGPPFVETVIGRDAIRAINPTTLTSSQPSFRVYIVAFTSLLVALLAFLVIRKRVLQ